MTKGDWITLLFGAGLIAALVLARRHNRSKNAAALSAAYASGHAEGHATALASVQAVQSVHVGDLNSGGDRSLGDDEAAALRIIRAALRREQQAAAGVGGGVPPSKPIPAVPLEDRGEDGDKLYLERERVYPAVSSWDRLELPRGVDPRMYVGPESGE